MLLTDGYCCLEVHPLFCLLQVPELWMLGFLNSVVYSPYAGAESRSNVGRISVNGEAIDLPRCPVLKFH